MKKSERQIFIMKLDTVGECAIKKHSGIKKKKMCNDNFVNETHRNIDESNQEKKRSGAIERMEKNAKERVQIKNYEHDNAWDGVMTCYTFCFTGFVVANNTWDMVCLTFSHFFVNQLHGPSWNWNSFRNHHMFLEWLDYEPEKMFHLKQLRSWKKSVFDIQFQIMARFLHWVCRKKRK